jgi:hypothetical protein
LANESPLDQLKIDEAEKIEPEDFVIKLEAKES